MATAWYCILLLLLAGYAVLDGFDLGAGVLHLWVARTNQERRTVLNAIGPVWDGNEVWLLAFGGALLLSFPRVYAASFSGFYLALIIVLWLLMGRGISLEFRGRINDPLWRGFWDAIFWVSSTLLAILYGVAVGNVIRGVPLNPQGYYQGLFEWMLNPYALLMGLFSLVLLTVHGAHYLALKSEGAVYMRARLAASRLWIPLVILAVGTTGATFAIRPSMSTNFQTFVPWLLVPLIGLVLLLVLPLFQRRGNDLYAFLSTAGLILALFCSTAIGLYPTVLPSHPHPERSFTVANAAASAGSLFPALIWMSFGLVLVIGYTAVVYTIFKGKVVVEEGSHY
jgi:cytochrome d ubiquinol oxidase subunit II